MAKTRLRSKFLTDRPAYKPGVYKNTMVWQWLQEVRFTDDDVGTAVRALKRRMDMPNQFPNRTYLHNYLLKAGLERRVVQRVHQHLWNLFTAYRDLKLHGVRPDDEDPWSINIRSSEPVVRPGFLGKNRNA